MLDVADDSTTKAYKQQWMYVQVAEMLHDIIWQCFNGNIYCLFLLRMFSPPQTASNTLGGLGCM